MKRTVVRGLFAVVLIGSGACAGSMTPSFMSPTGNREWPRALKRAKDLAADGSVLQADSLLANYASSYPGTPGAIESYYWRALMLVQSGAAPAPGPASMLDSYLKEKNIEHRIEAEALFRTASTVDSLTRAASTLSTKVNVSNGDVVTANSRAADAKADVKAVAADNRDQDAEIKRLKDELAKAKDELERIKKRLAEPPKKPPRG